MQTFHLGATSIKCCVAGRFHVEAWEPGPQPGVAHPLHSSMPGLQGMLKFAEGTEWLINRPTGNLANAANCLLTAGHIMEPG